ncbi:hypothetical protein [Novosphingobium sp. RL4]|uniref:hypothetical protein n=1 Tax=Novosphingobium sp. RL4 TaxID=3109595 RepID=UPI002D77A749|nr:hypothetical protein [Novosphingobium sp. RL4]WRT94404.1 hypothetical protein U9J33_07860 [Novosphingobium sp. RL4]
MLTIAILKYLGFLVTALAGIWSLVRKTTFEDAVGRKRLTASGHVAIAITITSAVISMLAFAVETLNTQREREVALGQAELQKLRSAQQRQADQQLIDRREADRNAAAARLQLSVLTSAAEQKNRDLRIARDVADGARRNLDAVTMNLAQIKRLTRPLKTLNLNVRVKLNSDIIDEGDYLRSRQGDRKMALESPNEWQSDDGTIRDIDGRLTIQYFPVDTGYPAKSSRLGKFLARFGTGVYIYASRKLSCDPQWSIKSDVDIGLTNSFESPLTYNKEDILVVQIDVKSNDLYILNYGERKVEQISLGQTVISEYDLSDAFIIPYAFGSIDAKDGESPALEMTEIGLASESFGWRIKGKDWSRMACRSSHSAYGPLSRFDDPGRRPTFR